MTVQEACQKAAEFISETPYGERDPREVHALLEALESVGQGHATTVVVGNPFDGLTLFGPFCDGEEANGWAMDDVREEWLAVATLDPESHPV